MPQTVTPQQPVVRPPKPRYEDLFREPAYPDGPYEQDDQDDDVQDPAIITP